MRNHFVRHAFLPVSNALADIENSWHGRPS